MPTPTERRAYEHWKQLSGLVHRFRVTGEATASNPALQQAVDSDPDGIFSPAFLLWTGDNFLQEARFAEALDAYRQVADRYRDRTFGGRSWAGIALEQQATCHEALEETDEAIGALQRASRAQGDDRADAWFRYEIGRVAEAAGRDDEAVRSFRQAADSSDEAPRGEVSIPDVARRAADRLESDRAWVRPSVNELASEVTGALRAGDGDRLRRLASPTHFSVGLLGSERQFVETERTLDLFIEELANSDVSANPAALHGSGGKLYLETRGWNGRLFNDSVTLLLSRTRDGFEWSGAALRMLPKEDGLDFPDIDLPHEDPPELPKDPPAGSEVPGSTPVTPADLHMKSPWPKGEHFRGGGIIPFSAQLALFASIAASWGPFAGFAFATQLLIASLASPCGFGPGGLWYGQPTTHVNRDVFAIDFARFVQGVPFLLDAFGKPVLAVAPGFVTFRINSSPTGDPTMANEVDIAHITQEEIFIGIIIEYLTGHKTTPKYTSEYLHLDGPNLIPVSVGMFVQQGQRLGRVDDTGLSVSHHLHFSLHDRDLPTATDSVRPTPMDGQSLNDWDDGRCLFSTNVPIP